MEGGDIENKKLRERVDAKARKREVGKVYVPLISLPERSIHCHGSVVFNGPTFQLLNVRKVIQIKANRKGARLT